MPAVPAEIKMVGPIVSQNSQVGPLRPDAAQREADDRRINEKAETKVSEAGSVGETNGSEDELLTAEGVAEKYSEGVLSTFTRLSIEADRDTGDYIYRFLDPDTGEVVRQYPREEFMELARKAKAEAGALLDQQV